MRWLDDFWAKRDQRFSAEIAREQLCHVRRVLPARRCRVIRKLTEDRMAHFWGNPYASVFSTPIVGTDTATIDPSVLLHVLRSRCLGIARAYFQATCGTPEILISLDHVVLRKFDSSAAYADEAKVPYHQDANALNHLAALNLWTLLSPDECGDTTPGLEFIPGQIQTLPLADRPQSTHYGFLEAGHEEIAQAFAERGSLVPSIALGDVMMFTELAIHRTHISAAHIGVRHSAEVRVIARTDHAREQIEQSDRPCYTVVGDWMRGPSVLTREGAMAAAGEWRVG